MSIFIKYENNELFKESYLDYFRKIDFLVAKYGEKIPTLFHPMILSKDEFGKIKKQSERIHYILEKTAELYFIDEKIANFYSFSSEMNEWLHYEKQYCMRSPIARYDSFFDGNKLSFCEFNTDGSSGFNDMFNLDESFLSTKLGKVLSKNLMLQRFNLPESILSVLLECYKKSNRCNKEKPTIAIVDYLERGSNDEFIFLEEFFNKKGYRSEICDLRNLEIHKGFLYCKNFKIDIVYRRAVTDDIFLYKESSKVFLRGCRDRLACIVGPLSSQLIHSKILFSLFFTDLLKKYLTLDEITFVRDAIPYTNFLFKESLSAIEEIKNNKNNYFIKPHNSYSSTGVVSGLDVSSSEWNKILDKILREEDKRYLVQNILSIPRSNFFVDENGDKDKFNVQIDPYLINGSFSGCFTRVSKNNITSLAPTLLPTFFL